jgi:hypothetical protein
LVLAVGEWAHEHQEEISAAQAGFDRRPIGGK